MIANWIHIAIVHFVVLGVLWMTFRCIKYRNLPLNGYQWKFNFSFLIVVGIFAAAAYFSGPEAADWTKTILNPYPQELIENHALWGRVAFVLQVIGALFGVMGWASIMQEELPDKRLPLILGVLLTSNTCILFYTAHLGGYIRRPDLWTIF